MYLDSKEQLPIPPGDELNMFMRVNGMSIYDIPMKEGALVQAGINQCCEPSMAPMLYSGNEVLDILSMLVVSYDRGVTKHSESVIPFEGPNGALESPCHLLVPEGVVDEDSCKHRSFTTLLDRGGWEGRNGGGELRWGYEANECMMRRELMVQLGEEIPIRMVGQWSIM
ncbi:hypothetical protein Tco_0000267 [Tanacetum coccineum]